MTVTPFYASFLAILLLVLSVRVVTYRRGNQISLGDAGDKSLLKRMRAQANCAEYAPMGLLLLMITELQGAPGFVLHLLGLMLVSGRLAHAYGFSASPPKMGLRVLGMVLTFTMLALTVIGMLVLAVL